MPHRTATRATSLFPGAVLLSISLAALLSACGDSGPHEITDVRKVKRVDPRELIERTHRDRFSLALPKEQRDAVERPPAPAGWSYITPDGWKEKPARGMRVASMEVPGVPPAEVSVFLLMLSDMLENVNRWRDQMGLPRAQASDLETMAYEHRGEQALLVDLEGSYNESGKPERFLGFLKEHQGRLLSVKFVGDTEVVTANEAKFHAFLQSLQPKAAPSGTNGGSKGENVPVGDEANLKGRLEWDTPAGWAVVQSASSQRIATFRIDGAPNLEVRVISLKGTGGGLSANVQMWAQMAGRKQLTDEEIGALTRIEVLGRKAVLVELSGERPLEPEGKAVKTRLLGLFCALESESLFIRVLGPAGEVESQRAAFIALCKSLRMKE